MSQLFVAVFTEYGQDSQCFGPFETEKVAREELFKFFVKQMNDLYDYLLDNQREDTVLTEIDYFNDGFCNGRSYVTRNKNVYAVCKLKIFK